MILTGSRSVRRQTLARSPLQNRHVISLNLQQKQSTLVKPHLSVTSWVLSLVLSGYIWSCVDLSLWPLCDSQLRHTDNQCQLFPVCWISPEMWKSIQTRGFSLKIDLIEIYWSLVHQKDASEIFRTWFLCSAYFMTQVQSELSLVELIFINKTRFLTITAYSSIINVS